MAVCTLEQQRAVISFGRRSEYECVDANMITHTQIQMQQLLTIFGDWDYKSCTFLHSPNLASFDHYVFGPLKDEDEDLEVIMRSK